MLHAKYQTSGPNGLSQEDFFLIWPIETFIKTGNSRGGANFDPEAIISIILMKDYQTMPHAKSLSPGPSGLFLKDFF